MPNVSTAEASPVDDASSTDIAVAGKSKEVDELSEWPPLTNAADIGVLDDRSIDWLDHAHPPELDDVPVDVPEEVIQIVKESLVNDQYRAPSISAPSRDSWRNSRQLHPPRPLPSESKTPIPRHQSISHSSQLSSSRSESSHVSTKSVPGYTVKMGPLGWIVVPDKTEEAPKKSKSTREGGLKKFLKERGKSGECASCMNSLATKYMVTLHCEHRYCHPCFSKLVSISMKHENIFPPKCCLGEIPVKTILTNLSRVQVDEYKLKEEEYATPVANRWYCPSTSCSKWIPPTKLTHSRDTQRCPHCHVIICATCRGVTHGRNGRCPRSFKGGAAPEVSETKGSRGCHRCQAKVELNTGYRTITCACGAHFCCICAAPLQSCSCTEVDEARWEEGVRLRRQSRNQQEDEAAQITAAIASAGYTARHTPDSSREQKREVDDKRQTRVLDEPRMLEISKKIQFLRVALWHVNKSQQATLISRHRSEAHDLEVRVSTSQRSFDNQCNRLTATLEVNLKARKEAMVTEHTSEMEKLRVAQEEEEDETFMNLCRYLRNKPNREAREAAIIEKLKTTQEEELVTLQEAQKAATRELEFNGSLELKGLISGMGVQRKEEQRKEKDSVFVFSKMVNIERSWFDAAIKKRDQLLEQLRTDLINGESGLKGLHITPPRDSAVELPANEPVVIKEGDYSWRGAELEAEVPIKLG